MKRILVEPRTPEWRAYRAESWTASMAATLVASENAVLLRDYAATKGVTLDIEPLLAVGLETFFDNTLWTVWAEKMGRIPRVNGAEQNLCSTSYEEMVLRRFENTELMTVEREVPVCSSEYNGIFASLDALAPQSTDQSVFAPFGFPVEAKCLAFVSRQKLWASRKKGELAIKGLPYYWCQVQHQMFATQAPYGWFVASGVETDKTGKKKLVFPLVEKVPRDEVFLKAYVAAAKFYHSHFIDQYEEPPKLPCDERMLEVLAQTAEFDRAILANDPDTAVDLYLSALRDEKVAVDRRTELEERVIMAAAAMRAAGSDIVVLSDRLHANYVLSAPTSWQKVAKELATAAGLPDIPAAVIENCKAKPKECVKLKEVV